MGHLANMLGKWLFPNSPRDMRRRKVNNLFIVLLISLIVMGGIALAMVLMGK